MDRGSWRDRSALTETEQATLRIRLAATALGVTILVLVPGHDQVAAASLLLGYAAVALILRVWGARLPASAAIGVATDVLFATALSLLLPLSAAWVMYLFAIGVAALRGGVRGLAAAVAGSVVAYDVVLAVRADDALAADLWRIQVLLAFAVVAAELVWVVMRTRAERHELRAYSLAQRDLAAARDADEMLGRLTDHAVRSFGASAAWIERAGEVAHGRGAIGRVAPSATTTVPVTDEITLHAAFDDAAHARGLAALRDLAADARPLVETASAAARERSERDAERGTLDTVHRLARETSSAGVLALAITTAQELFGQSAVVRAATGERLVGDLDAEVATRVARDGVPPRLASGGPPAAASAAAVAAGPGLVLVALGTRRPLGGSDLGLLAILGDATATALERVRERETLVSSVSELRSRSEELEHDLRQRDDAVASAVHELRNPLTSVRAYGQLMSRHLSAVQRQVTQLDSLIGDLLRVPAGAPPRALAMERSDLAREIADAAARLRVSVPGTDVRVIVDVATRPHEALVDASRFSQVLDNVLRNAAKYSPPGAPIDVTLSRQGDEILIAVADRGDGIATDERERIFERYVRGARHAGSLPGAGLGLAVSREIVAAHGGRIWADSPGPGEGSTFTIALPAAEVGSEAGSPAGEAPR